MWNILFAMALPLVPLAAAHSGVVGQSIVSGAAADVQCLIRAKPVGGGVELEGVVASGAPLFGVYQFDVRKSGSAGTSSSTQSGDFEVQSGEEVVGQVGLGLESGATYDAKLVLRWKGGHVSCATKGPEET